MMCNECGMFMLKQSKKHSTSERCMWYQEVNKVASFQCKVCSEVYPRIWMLLEHSKKCSLEKKVKESNESNKVSGVKETNEVSDEIQADILSSSNLLELANYISKESKVTDDVLFHFGCVLASSKQEMFSLPPNHSVFSKINRNTYWFDTFIQAVQNTTNNPYLLLYYNLYSDTSIPSLSLHSFPSIKECSGIEDTVVCNYNRIYALYDPSVFISNVILKHITFDTSLYYFKGISDPYLLTLTNVLSSVMIEVCTDLFRSIYKKEYNTNDENNKAYRSNEYLLNIEKNLMIACKLYHLNDLLKTLFSKNIPRVPYTRKTIPSSLTQEYSRMCEHKRLNIPTVSYEELLFD